MNDGIQAFMMDIYPLTRLKSRNKFGLKVQHKTDGD